jgi:hypothetical protein
MIQNIILHSPRVENTPIVQEGGSGRSWDLDSVHSVKEAPCPVSTWVSLADPEMTHTMPVLVRGSLRGFRSALPCKACVLE